MKRSVFVVKVNELFLKNASFGPFYGQAVFTVDINQAYIFSRIAVAHNKAGIVRYHHETCKQYRKRLGDSCRTEVLAPKLALHL